MKNEKTYEVAIIGAGPAGISCAIQLQRYGISPLILEKNEIGGLLRNANLVENYPGFPQGLSGRELVTKFQNQLETLQISPIYEEVTKVSASSSHPELTSSSINFQTDEKMFKLKTSKNVFSSKFLVVASGTIPREPAIKTSETIFYDLTELYKENLSGKTVAIIGSGDAAFDYALNLADNSEVKEITILNRGAITKCLLLLKENARKNPKIRYIENEEPAKFDGKTLICAGKKTFNADYTLAAIGRVANTAFVNEDLIPHPKLFFIGDVKNGNFRQTAIAAGDGIKTAMRIAIK